MEAALLVTGTCTVAVLADRLVAAIARLVFAGTIVAGMAARTVRLERRILPGNDLGVLLMTVCASQVAAMIQWFKRRRSVTELVRCKRNGVVAAVAFLSRAKMAVILAECNDAVVAGRTGAQNLRVIDRKHRRPYSRCMTVFAYVGC